MLAALATAANAQPQNTIERFRAGQADALSAPDPGQPGNWECAQPLIQRNFRQQVDSEQLALRIADECTRPYRPRPIRNEADPIFESRERLSYTYRAQTFRYEIEAAIQQARRREAITLN